MSEAGLERERDPLSDALSDVWAPAFRASVRRTWAIAPAAEGRPLGPVLPGSEHSTPPWVLATHDGDAPAVLHGLACYEFKDALVSGDGHLWLGGRLVTAPEIMPLYVRHLLEADAGLELPEPGPDRPIRVVKSPCLVAAGHGPQVYGHFLIEVLFRVLMAKLARKAGAPRHKVLIDKDAPPWFVAILTQHLDVAPADLEMFDPASECVLLRRAIVPTRVLQEPGFHPAANGMLDALIARLAPGGRGDPPRRVFISRQGFVNHSAPYRICENEDRLAEIAETSFGFTPVVIETLSWPEQIRLFRNAEIIVGQAGSGLHNALFCSPGGRLGSIGFMNFVQAQIAALRGQSIAYFARDFDLAGEFSVDEPAFAAFLAMLCGEAA